MDDQPTIAFLSNDLMFYSQINTAAKAAGLRSALVKNQDELATRTSPASLEWLIVDLSQHQTDLAKLAVSLKSIAPSARLLGFGAHVDAEVLQSARESGFDDVMPRSKFHNLLPHLFAKSS